MDISKLKTVANFARMKEVSPQSVYAWIENGKVKSIKIDGVTFIIVK